MRTFFSCINSDVWPRRWYSTFVNGSSVQIYVQYGTATEQVWFPYCTSRWLWLRSSIITLVRKILSRRSCRLELRRLRYRCRYLFKGKYIFWFLTKFQFFQFLRSTEIITRHNFFREYLVASCTSNYEIMKIREISIFHCGIYEIFWNLLNLWNFCLIKNRKFYSWFLKTS